MVNGKTVSGPSRHIYWDQASVLMQIGLLDPASLPIAGVETARKVLDNSLPSNELLGAAWTSSRNKPIQLQIPCDTSYSQTAR